MSPGQAVRAVLLDSSAVAGLAGARIYPVRLPPNVVFPAVVFTVVDKIPQGSFRPTRGDLKLSRVQIDSYGKSYDDAHDLAQAIEDYLVELDGADITVEPLGSRDLFENDTLLHRVAADFHVWSA